MFPFGAMGAFPRHKQMESPTAIRMRPSIAVLGFKNLSGKTDEDWISLAFAEMLSAELAAGQQARTIPGEIVARRRQNRND